MNVGTVLKIGAGLGLLAGGAFLLYGTRPAVSPEPPRKEAAMRSPVPPASAPAPAPAPQGPAVPDGMVHVPGGLVTLGPYAADPADWGRRELYLRPYFIDQQAITRSDPASCRNRGGRLAHLPELEHALRVGLIKPGGAAELTESMVTPADSDVLENTEGVGFYEVCLRGLDTVELHLPTAERIAQLTSRCVLPVTPPPAEELRTLTYVTEIRRGRSERWPVVSSIFSTSEDKRPLKLGKGQSVALHHADGSWSLIGLPNHAEPLGWVPTANLSPK